MYFEHNWLLCDNYFLFAFVLLLTVLSLSESRGDVARVSKKLACQRGRGRMKIIAAITQVEVIREIDLRFQ